MSNITVSSGAGDTLLSGASASAEVPACATDCAGVCNGDSVEDECGVCDGSGPAENFDCDGNCVVDVDCAGECGGSLAQDDCGVCDGSNDCYTGSLSLGDFDASAGTLEVLYDFAAPVAGFQFDLSGLAVS